MKLRLTCTRMMENYGTTETKELLMIQSMPPLSIKHGEGSIISIYSCSLLDLTFRLRQILKN